MGISNLQYSNKIITIPYNEELKYLLFTITNGLKSNQKYDESYQEDQRDVVFCPGDFHPFAFMGDFPDIDEDLKIRIYV